MGQIKDLMRYLVDKLDEGKEKVPYEDIFKDLDYIASPREIIKRARNNNWIKKEVINGKFHVFIPKGMVDSIRRYTNK
jgi:hypothetical protein